MISLLPIVKLTLILSLGSVAFALSRRASAAAKHLLCAVTLAVALMLPLTPQLPSVGEPRVFHLMANASAAVVTGHAATFHWLPVIWLTGALLIVIRFLLGVFYLAWQARQSVPEINSPAIRGVQVRLANTTTPMIWGWVRPTVLAPLSFAGWTEERKRLAVLHEVAHIERADNWTALVAVAACAVYWFHPLVWWLAKKLKQQQEIACDDRVLATGAASSTEYAGLLVDVARQLSSAARFSCAMVPDKGYLRHRVMHILKFQTSPCSSRWSRVAVSSGISALLLASILIPMKAEKTPQKQQTVYKIGGRVTLPTLIYKVEPKYSKETRDAKIQGAVILRLIVSSTGVPQDIHVLRALAPDLDRNAVQAVAQWRFQPATRNGQPVFVRATVEVNFRLE